MLETVQILVFNAGRQYDNFVCKYKTESSQQEETKITESQYIESYTSFLLQPARFPVFILSIENDGFVDDNNGQSYCCPLAGTYLLGCGNLVYLWPTCETLPRLEQVIVQEPSLFRVMENDPKQIVRLCQDKLAVSSMDKAEWLNVAIFLKERLCYLFHVLFQHNPEEEGSYLCTSPEQLKNVGEDGGLVELVGQLARFCLWLTVIDMSDNLNSLVHFQRFGMLQEDNLLSTWTNKTGVTEEEEVASKCIEFSKQLMILCCLLTCELVDVDQGFLDKVPSLLPILFSGSLPVFPHFLRYRCLKLLCKLSKLPHWVTKLDQKMRRDLLITLSIHLSNFRAISEEMQIMLVETLYRLGCYSVMDNLFESFLTSKLLKNVAFYAKQDNNASLAACASIVCEFVLNNYEDSFGFLVDANVLEQHGDLLTMSSYHRSIEVLCQHHTAQGISEIDRFHEKFLVATQEQRKSLGIQNVIHCFPTERKASVDMWEALMKDPRKWNNWLQNRTKMVRKLVMYGIPMQVRALIWRRLLKTDQMMQRYRGAFGKLLRATRPKEVDDVIERDIVRTLPSHHIFWSFGAAPGIDSLRSILLAYAALVPQVGYCQGMSSIAAMILLFSCDVEEAFLNFVYMMDTVGFHDLFYPGFTMLKTRVAEFHGIALFYFPQLMKHLTVEGIHPMMFVDKWFLTACIYNFPFALVIRLWDIMLSYSHTKIIMRAGLAILEIGKDRMMQMQFEELIQFVQKGFADSRDGVVGDVDYFIEKAMSFRFRRKRASALAKRSDIMEQVDMRQRTVLGCFSSSLPNTKTSQTRPLEMLEKWIP